jgi:hypothetical protein
VLDELDRALEHRGHRFVRYADDCNIYVRSETAGHRVMTSLTRFIEGRLKLQVNAQKAFHHASGDFADHAPAAPPRLPRPRGFGSFGARAWVTIRSVQNCT